MGICRHIKHFSLLHIHILHIFSTLNFSSSLDILVLNVPRGLESLKMMIESGNPWLKSHIHAAYILIFARG